MVENIASSAIMILTGLMEEAETARARIIAGEMHAEVSRWRDEGEGTSPRTRLSPHGPRLLRRAPLRKVAGINWELLKERRAFVRERIRALEALTHRHDHCDWLVAIDRLLLNVMLEWTFATDEDETVTERRATVATLRDRASFARFGSNRSRSPPPPPPPPSSSSSSSLSLPHSSSQDALVLMVVDDCNNIGTKPPTIRRTRARSFSFIG